MIKEFEVRDIVRFGIILMVVVAFASGSLAIVYNATEGKRKEVLEEERQKALLEVLPEAKVFELVRKGDISYYIGRESKDREKIVGIAFIAEGKGYSSTIETMVGITPDGEITGLKVLSQQETPGLGARIEEPWFQQQFVGKKLEDLYIDKMDTVTGATISSGAVIDSVREKIEKVYGVHRP